MKLPGALQENHLPLEPRICAEDRVVGHTYILHCSSFLGLPFRIFNIDLVKPKKGTARETIGKLCFVLSV